MKGHQHDTVLRFIHIVHVGHQGNFLQKTVQSRIFLIFTVADRFVNQLLDILKTCFRLNLALRLDFLLVSGILQHFFDQLLDAHLWKACFKIFNLLCKNTDLVSRLAKGRYSPYAQKGVIKAHPIGRRKYRHLADRGGSDPPLRNIDDTLYRQIILPVGNRLQIAENIFDFFSLIEVHAAHQTIGNTVQDTFLLQQTGLGVCPVKHGKVGIFPACLFLFPSYVFYNRLSLLIGRIKLQEPDQIPLVVGCPKRLILPAPVIAYHSVGCVQDILGGTVVLLQLNYLSPRKCLLKAQDILDIGASEFVNGLIIITYHADIPVFSGQQIDELELHHIGILVLVHHYVTETLLIIIQHIRNILEQLHRFYNQVVKIKGVILL